MRNLIYKTSAFFIISVAFVFSVTSVSAQTNPNATIDPAQIARGAQAWSKECNRCHNLRSPSELSDEEWVVSTTHMRVRANIPGDVIKDIQAFLKNANK